MVPARGGAPLAVVPRSRWFPARVGAPLAVLPAGGGIRWRLCRWQLCPAGGVAPLAVLPPWR